MIKGIKHMYAINQSKFRESKTFSSLRSLQKVDMAGVHDGHAVCHVCHNAQVMGDVDNGHAQLFLQVADQLQDCLLYTSASSPPASLWWSVC